MQRGVFDSIDHGRLERFVTDNEHETLHLEFKRLKSSSLKSDDDARNLARAISGFANAAGGIVIWGVATNKDENGREFASSLEPLSDLGLAIARAHELTAGATDPPVPGVLHRAIKNPRCANTGCLVTFVPASDRPPHMAMLGGRAYYTRIGSSFLQMEHFQLADLFGRRSSPRLSLEIDVRPSGGLTRVYNYEITFSLRNSGLGVARFPWVELTPEPPYSPLHQHGFAAYALPRVTSRHDPHAVLYAGDANSIVHIDTTIDVTSVFDSFPHDRSQLPRDFACRYMIAADGLPPARGRLSLSGIEIASKLPEESPCR